MTVGWTPQELELVGRSQELEIATVRANGTSRRWTPIWVVRVGEQVYVRTWHRRESGWFGDAVSSPSARIRLPGLERAVVIADLGQAPADLRAEVDGAYREKYGRYGQATVERMASDEAAATTLRLTPVR